MALIAPHSYALTIIVVSASIAVTKSKGETGSPWRNPSGCLNFFPGQPFTRTRELAVDTRIGSREYQCSENPFARSTSSKSDHERESKPREMSIFNITPLAFLLCIFLATCRMSVKLSCMFLPLIKANWLICTSSPILGLNLIAISLEASFGIL